MSEEKKLNEQELDGVNGGYGYYNNNGWVTVCKLQSGYLAMRTKPNYDYNNEIRGCELNNGDQVQITGSYVAGYDGKTYVWVFSPKSGVSGYVNAYYLG